MGKLKNFIASIIAGACYLMWAIVTLGIPFIIAWWYLPPQPKWWQIIIAIAIFFITLKVLTRPLIKWSDTINRWYGKRFDGVVF